MERIKEILKEFHYTPIVHAIIDGELYKLNEPQVRALQVLCKRMSAEGKFEEFNKRYVVYTINGNGDYIKIIFRPDGRFSNAFRTGFYDINEKLAFELL